MNILKRLKFSIWFVINFIPVIWMYSEYKYFEVAVFYCNDEASWERYCVLKQDIAKIIDPRTKEVSAK